MNKINVEVYTTDNPEKLNLIKRYSNGCYYTNQLIMGRLFYRKWSRIKKRDVIDLFKTSHSGRRILPIESIEFSKYNKPKYKKYK